MVIYYNLMAYPDNPGAFCDNILHESDHMPYNFTYYYIFTQDIQIMTTEEKLLHKSRLKQFCEQVIEQRVTATRTAMNNAQSAANNEEKSSAGDKYETSRAMNHLEKDMHARQLMAHLQELSFLRAVNTNTIYKTVTPGAVIQCEKLSFFIAAGLGKQLIDNIPVVFLSPQSPLSKTMSGKKTGDTIDFNGPVKIIGLY